MQDDDAEWRMDLDVKLAFQERLIRELDALVRSFSDRLAKTEKALAEIKQSVAKPGDERPPHY